MSEQTRGLGGWIGVDFDGGLAEDAVGLGIFPQVGPPIPAMIDRVQRWLREGKDVRIFTARVGPGTIAECAVYGRSPEDWLAFQRGLIENFSLGYFGVVLPVTCVKDFKLIELWDDRCVQMEPNTGRPLVEGLRKELREELRQALRASEGI